jgi:hypothetical protein
MTHGSEMVGQGRVERELAAGCDPVYFDAEPDGVKQKQVGRLNVDEFPVTHDFSLGRLQPERGDGKDGTRSCWCRDFRNTSLSMSGIYVRSGPVRAMKFNGNSSRVKRARPLAGEFLVPVCSPCSGSPGSSWEEMFRIYRARCHGGMNRDRRITHQLRFRTLRSRRGD